MNRRGNLPIEGFHKKVVGQPRPPGPRTCPKCGHRGLQRENDNQATHVRRRYKCVNPDCSGLLDGKEFRWSTYEVTVEEEEREEELDLPTQMREHILSCKKCTPFKACTELLLLHAEFLKELNAPTRLLPPASDDNYYELFNPQCQHERCAWDIANCDACIAYSKEQHRLKSQAAKAIEVKPDATEG